IIDGGQPVQVAAHRRQGPFPILRVQPLLPFIKLIADLVVLVAEHTFRAGTEIDLVAAEVPVPDAVAGALHGHFEALATDAQLFFGAAALDELADLAAQGLDHRQELAVRLADFVAEGLDDARYLATGENGKRKGGVQVTAGGDLAAREVGLLRDVGDPGRGAIGPDAAGQTDARGTGERAGHRGKLRRGASGPQRDI